MIYFRVCSRVAVCAAFFVLAFTLALEGPPSEIPIGETRSGAFEALDFWSQSRAYPYADIPPDRFYRAYEYARTHVQAIQTESAAAATWEFIGPINFSGRMISIAINPLNSNTIYAGAASGGLWRSFTGGISGDWQRVTTGLPVLGIGALAIDPVDTSIIYAGTGEVYRYGGALGGLVIRPSRGSYGLGILKTTNGGSTWTQSLNWTYNQERGVQAIRINPLNRNTLLAATTEGVYRSTNAGGTWTQTLAVVMARDITFNRNDTTEVLATCGNFASIGHGVYRSADGGQTFAQIGSFPTFSGMAVLGVYAANPERVYVHLAESTTVIGTTWRSTNFGQAWTLINTSTTGDVQGWYARFLAVHPTDSSKIVRGAQGLWRSTNSGTSFSQIIQGWADYHGFAHHPTNPEILYIVDDGGVWKSTNFGTSYTYVGSGLQTSQFYNGFSTSSTDSNHALGQVQDHFGYKYTGSTTWPGGGVDEVGWTAINQSNDFIQYAGSRSGGSVYKSTNRGVSFTSSGSGIIGGTSAWNAPFVLSTSNPSFLYFGRSRVFKSTNAAVSWTVTNSGLDLDGNPSLSMAMSHTNTDSVYVATAPLVTRSHVYRTANAGTSWTDITGILPDRYPLDIAVDPGNSRVVYIGYGGFGSHVFRSTDAGSSWTDISGNLPDVPATALLVDPENSDNVYVGTDLGVYLSTDGGTNWFSFNEGFPEAVLISDLSLSTGPRILRAVTHSNGVYQRDAFETITGQPPVVSDIPNQTVALGGRFAPIRADIYVSDPDHTDPEITWTWSGNSSLTVTWIAASRRIRVRAPNNWTGNETIIFTATDPDGLSDSDPATFTVTASAEKNSTSLDGSESSFPLRTELLGNFPNPFNPSTTINYGLSEDSWVTLAVYNSLGQEVTTLVNDFERAGYKSVVWNGRNDSGAAVASGIYIYRITAGPFTGTRRMVVLK